MTPVRTAILVCLGLIAASAPAQPAGLEARPDPTRRDRLIDRVERLAALPSRRPGTPSAAAAADQIESALRALRLEPAFGDRFRAEVSFDATAQLQSSTLSVRTPDGPEQLVAGEDFAPLAYGDAETGELPVAFAGYAIASGPGGYLGFPAVADFTGKAVIVLTYEPLNDAGRSRFRRDGRFGRYSNINGKLLAVTRRGAEAVLLVSPFPDSQELDLAVESAAANDAIEVPVMQITPAIASRLLEAAGEDFETLIELANQGEAVRELEDVTIDLGISIRRIERRGENVGALLPGRSELARDLVVVMAHHDTPEPPEAEPDEIRRPTAGLNPALAIAGNPGAGNNASGVAAMLEVARTLTAAFERLPPGADARSVLFLATTGGEERNLGARAYLESPPRSPERHALVVNLDSVAGPIEQLQLSGSGTATNLAPIVERELAARALAPRLSPAVAVEPGEETRFDRERIPTLAITTGVPESSGTPGDSPQSLDPATLETAADLAAAVVLGVARSPERFEYAIEGRRIGEQENTASRIAVDFGFAPRDYSQRGGGVLVTLVREQGPAARAGIQPGDRVIAWDGTEIPFIRDWVPLLTQNEPGDTVTVRILRDGDEFDARLELVAIDR
ncbi:MAG: M28 family peptidase [Planctomycetota bacterium]